MILVGSEGLRLGVFVGYPAAALNERTGSGLVPWAVGLPCVFSCDVEYVCSFCFFDVESACSMKPAARPMSELCVSRLVGGLLCAASGVGVTACGREPRSDDTARRRRYPGLSTAAVCIILRRRLSSGILPQSVTRRADHGELEFGVFCLQKKIFKGPGSL